MIKLKLRWIIPLCVGMVLVGAAKTGLLPLGKGQEQQAVAAPVVSVTVDTVKSVTKLPKLVLTGTLEGETSAAISAKIGGRIEQVLVEDGQPVVAGQPLIRLESLEAANAVRVAEEAVRRAEVNFDNVQTDFERYQQLYNQSAISRQQLDSADMRLKVARADVASAYASLSSAQQQYSYTVIVAPVGGVTANKYATLGQVVAAGTTLLTVENIASVYAVVNIEQQDMASIVSGLPAEVTVDTYAGLIFRGAVEIINPAAATSNRMFRVKVKVDNSQGKLRPGMFVKVRLITGQEQTVLSVTQAALFQKNGLYYVYVAENGKAIRHQVDAKQVLDGGRMEITGLPESTPVIITNVNKLKDGDAVSVARSGEQI